MRHIAFYHAGMSALQPWFERKFTFDLPTSRLPNVMERLRGTPARVEERVRLLPAELLTARVGKKWSIQENVGHLCDLESLWTRRAEQLLRGESDLVVADLTNRLTDEANHNATPIQILLDRFRTTRLRLVSILESADPAAQERTARHPRLGTPMRLIDVAFFVAEHDDHHLATITAFMAAAGTP